MDPQPDQRGIEALIEMLLSRRPADAVAGRGEPDGAGPRAYQEGLLLTG